MTKPDSATAALKPRERVTLTRNIREAAEGTSGVVKVANGLTWPRYWIQFDNGAWVGSVSGADLVREDDWEAFQQRRAEEALRPKVEEKPAAAAPEAGAGAAAKSNVPAHLLERSQKARARKAGGGE